MKTYSRQLRTSDVVVEQKANPIQKKIIGQFCEEEFEAQVSYLRNKYQLVDYNPQLSYNHSSRFIASYGGELVDGEPFVTLALWTINTRVGETGTFLYEEYDFLAHKDGIGNDYANWKKWTAWLIAHELAHTLVECERFRLQIEKYFDYEIKRDRRAHGKFWQAVYRDLRCVFCEGRTYNVDYIDFSDYVYEVASNKRGRKNITFFRGETPVAFYVRERGILYRSNATFSRRWKTGLKNTGQIKKNLVTA